MLISIYVQKIIINTRTSKLDTDKTKYLNYLSINIMEIFGELKQKYKKNSAL